MIEVWISGRTRRAVVDDGQDVRLLRYGAPDDLEPCSPRQIDALRDAGAAEMRVLSAPPDPRALHAELARAVATARARSGIETLLDPDFSLAARHLAAEEVEPLLGDAAVARATAARLEVGPLPVEPDVRGARRLCDVNRLEHVAALVEAYGDKLAVLRAAWEAWDELLRRADLDVAAQENAREWFATSGGFAALSDEVRQPARHAFAQWLVSRAASAPAPMRTAARTLKRLPKLVRERLARYDTSPALTPAAIVAESKPPVFGHVSMNAVVINSAPHAPEETARLSAQGREALAAGLYEDAVRALKALTASGEASSSDHYHLALALTCHRGAHALTSDDLLWIERLIRLAEPAATSVLLLALVKDHYYPRHGRTPPPPTVKELLAEAWRLPRDRGGLQELGRHVDWQSVVRRYGLDPEDLLG